MVYALRRAKFRKVVLGPLLRNVETPEPRDGKLPIRFKSKSLSERFMTEMEDGRAKEAFKDAIVDVYGPDITVEIRSPHAAQSAESQENDPATSSPLVRAAMAMGATLVGQEDAPDAE